MAPERSSRGGPGSGSAARAADRWPPTPGLGRSRTADWRLAGEHLSERYRQFVIIALGETILVTGATFSAAFTPASSAAAVAAFLTTVLLWRVYFHRTTELLPAAGTGLRHPAGLGRLAAYEHVIIVAGIVVTAVSDRLVLTHATARVRLSWLLPMLAGPALFVAGRALFEYTLFASVPWSRPGALAALGALVPLMLFLPVPTLAVSFAVMVVLLAVVVVDTLTVPVTPRRGATLPR